VSLKGLASLYQPDGGNPIGLIYRAILSSIVLGFVTHLVMKKKAGTQAYPIAVTSAAFLGLVFGRVWVAVGVDYFSNLIGWLQNASVLRLIGGPRGLVTRLTLWLALLGASLAASKGKHINIDIATRYLPKPIAMPAALASLIAGSLVCFAAAYGFTDSIAVTKFRAEALHSCPSTEGGEGKICDTRAIDRLATAVEGMSTDFFLLRKQIALDLRSIPHVLVGSPYDKYFSAEDWNAWIKDAGWEDHFPKESVAAMAVPDAAHAGPKMPAVVAPDTGEGPDLLIRDLNFVLPFGLLVVGLKTVLRILLILSGRVKVDPEAAHSEEALVHSHGAEPDKGGA
jgi:hypothetical protein